MIVFVTACAVLLGLLWALHWLWRRRIEAELTEGAAGEYERHRARDPELMEGMTLERFRAIYARVERPRYPTYLLGAITAFALGTPVLLALMSGAAYYAQRAGLIAQPGEAANRIYFSDSGTASIARRVSPEALSYILQGWAGFYYFFGLLFFWILIVAVAMRRYHARTPGFLREEVLRSR
ncbi:hypothetical protein [Parvularcula dongshanensis]|uniref:Uncharacterized protein n=1 Tax=Parvularcula dongshanensis TaxID=1173995 RepID=A0A840I1N4_9PROT|nr:hypothetical protein [Parvularcula dongshanensis]MBB4657980.1 hypothetical protein [Parvularcula dongshanensis]